MGESEYTIKVKTDADVTDLESLREILEEIRENALSTGTDLSEGLDEASSSADETASSFENAENSAEGLSNSLDGIDGSSLEETSNNAEQLADSMERAGESTEQFSTGMGVMEGSMLLSASEQIGAMGDKTEGLSQSLDNAQISIGQLATKTGMAEGEVTNMINHISNVTFPRDEAIAYTNALNQMGVANQDLAESATNMDRINDATHIGYGKVIQLSQGFRSLGVDVSNLPSTFNAIAYAESNVTGGADTLSMVLKTQGGVISEYGLNADQLVVIMKRLSEQGYSQRKMGSKLSEVLKETNGDTQALEQSLGLTAGSLSNASDETGKFEGKLMDMANQEMEHKTITERLGAVWEDFSLTLAPIISPLGSVVGLLGQVGSMALGINGIITLAETFGLLNSANLALIPSQIAEGVAGLFSIGWVLIAIAVILVLVGVLWYLYNNNETVRQAIDNFAQTLQYVAGVIYSSFINALQQVWSTLLILWNIVNIVIQGLINAVNSGNGNILSSIANVIVYLSQLPLRLATIFANMIARALGFGDNFVQRMRQTAINSANGFINNIRSLPNRLLTELNQMLSYVNSWASTLPQKFWNAGVNAVKNFLSALGIASPGTMQRMLIWEVTEMGRRVPEESRNLLANVGQLGEDIVDEFGNPSLDITSNATLLSSNMNEGTGNAYFTINIGTVDNEERVQDIVDAVTKALAWNNITAGRSV